MKTEITERGVRGRWRFNKATGELEQINKPSPQIVDAPFVQDDTIEPVESMVDASRRMFDSKSALLEHYRENGYECTGPVGLKPRSPYKPDREQMINDWREAERLAKWGMSPRTEKEKQYDIEEERRYEAWKQTQSTKTVKKPAQDQSN